MKKTAEVTRCGDDSRIRLARHAFHVQGMSLQNMTRFTPDRLGGRGENQRGRYVQTCKQSLETSRVELWNPKGHEQLQLLLFILAVPELISLGASSQVPPFSLHVPSHASTATCTRIQLQTHTGSWNFGQNLPQA